MSAQWIRKMEILIGLSGGNVIDVSELHAIFETEAWTIETPKTLQCRIYNIAPVTIKKIIDEGSNISIAAGYENSFGTIFYGTIVQLRSGRLNGTDTYLDISGIDGDVIYNNAFVSATISAGSTAIGRLKSIAKSGGFILGQVPEQDTPQLPRGRVYFGAARTHLRPLAATLGANWTITNGTVNVIPQNAYKKGDVPVFTYATGLIGVPQQTLEGIAIKVLLNPAVEQGIKVKIDNASIQQFQVDLGIGAEVNNAWIPPIDRDGIYKILYCTHSGDTRGQGWYTDMIGISGDHITSPSQFKYSKF